MSSYSRIFCWIAVLLASAAAHANSLRLEVDVAGRELRAVVGDREIERFGVAVGKDSHPTPQGSYLIRKVIWNPSWRPPDEKWARGKSATPPGHPDNPMKDIKIFFKPPDYYIHGTNDEKSIGQAASHGCIRMTADDATRLGRLVMEFGGKPQPEPWYRRILRRRSTKVVILADPVPIEIGG